MHPDRPPARTPGVTQIDVVLPVLDEGGALPWVLGGCPRATAPIVVDNGSTDGSAELGRSARRARSCTSRRRGFGAACCAGLQAADRGRRVLHGLRRARSTRASCRASSARSSATRRTSCSARAARRPRRLAAPRAGGQPGGSPSSCAGARGVRAARPRPDARRPPRGAARPRDRGPPLRLAAGDGRCAPHAAGWRIAEVDVRYRSREGRSKVTGTVRGIARTVRDMAEVLP